MPTVYGREAVEVEQPDGEIICYLVRAVPAVPEMWRSWEVTSPGGDTYTVSESPRGFWTCDCPAHTLGKNRGGRWQTVGRVTVCKHCGALHQWLTEQAEAADASSEAKTR
jgi:hypothetical protein